MGYAAQVLAERDDLLAFQLKMSPHVAWSHPAAAPYVPCVALETTLPRCAPPSLELFRNDLDDESKDVVLVWNRREGCFDWDYGWDLCCSLYRGRDFNFVLEQLSRDAKGHPNRLEAQGALAVRDMPPASACFARPVLAVLAVNRVQDVYQAPIYECRFDLDALNKLDDRLDPRYYRDRRFDSVHVGDLVFQGVQPPLAAKISPELSVLMPARNAAKTVAAAVASLTRQRDVNLEVIVIDDGSTDDTAALATGDPRVRVVRNHRRSGVAHALNVGLQVARGAFVARLDADDLCFRGDRLASQLAFLRANPSLVAVGGACVTFADDAQKTPGRYVGHPCQPLRVAWLLHFSCVVAHPTILARADALRDLGGYSVRVLSCVKQKTRVLQEAAVVRHAEDYDLWLRLTEVRPRGLANLAEPLVWLRKAATSVSSTHRRAQHGAAEAAAVNAFARRLPTTRIDPASAALLRRPGRASCARGLADAANLLLALEAAFLRRDLEASDDEVHRARAAVTRDVDARLAELALLAARLSPTDAPPVDDVFRLWAARPSSSSASARHLLAALAAASPASSASTQQPLPNQTDPPSSSSHEPSLVHE